MKSNKKFLALIPARAGSKGIKDKNIIDLKGKPLIAYSIDAALKSKYIDRVVVSTDGEEIAAVAKEWGADVPFLRPDYLASDTAKTIDAVLHCIEALKKAGDSIGVEIKSEIQSDGKIINELSINDIKESTAVLFAIDGEVEEVEKIERFIDCEYYEVEEQFIKNDAKSVLQEILSDLN